MEEFLKVLPAAIVIGVLVYLGFDVADDGKINGSPFGGIVTDDPLVTPAKIGTIPAAWNDWGTDPRYAPYQ